MSEQLSRNEVLCAVALVNAPDEVRAQKDEFVGEIFYSLYPEYFSPDGLMKQTATIFMDALTKLQAEIPKNDRKRRKYMSDIQNFSGPKDFKPEHHYSRAFQHLMRDTYAAEELYEISLILRDESYGGSAEVHRRTIETRQALAGIHVVKVKEDQEFINKLEEMFSFIASSLKIAPMMVGTTYNTWRFEMRPYLIFLNMLPGVNIDPYMGLHKS